jgi:hypothetical protein
MNTLVLKIFLGIISVSALNLSTETEKPSGPAAFKAMIEKGKKAAEAV